MTVALVEEADIVTARQRARQIAGLLGFEGQDQARIATAVSEIARNAISYGGGGRALFSVQTDMPPTFVTVVRDSGAGIEDLDAILQGRFQSASGMGLGIVGSRRLMDVFDIKSQPGVGTEVTFGKHLPRARSAGVSERLGEISKTLASSRGTDPLAETRLQNQELLQALAELSAKREETERLNIELENTNRGVLALYAELDEKAAQLTTLNGELEQRVATAVQEVQHVNDALRQSQRMEAIGQLTGGVAHDFNNLLHVVLGNLELLKKRLPPDDARLHRAAENAMQGAQRAATLTQRLLAFSRRQPLAPKPINSNQLVEGMSDLLRTTLGETIAITLDLPKDLWQVEVDANQLENALLNLAVNARDAMQTGGTLSIKTANGVIREGDQDDDALPGHYVSLAVSDTGSGMSPQI